MKTVITIKSIQNSNFESFYWEKVINWPETDEEKEQVVKEIIEDVNRSNLPIKTYKV
jgi:hypothetical protein